MVQEEHNKEWTG